jgi:hypothetical protein
MAASKDESKTLFVAIKAYVLYYETFDVAFYVNITVCRSREYTARNTQKQNAKRTLWWCKPTSRGTSLGTSLPAHLERLDLMPLLHSAFMICATL